MHVFENQHLPSALRTTLWLTRLSRCTKRTQMFSVSMVTSYESAELVQLSTIVGCAAALEFFR
jgi:hypothetical protein